MRRWLICVLVTFATPLWAEIFKSVDEFGNVVFSDLPPPNKAEKVQITPTNSYEPAAAVAPPAGSSSNAAAVDANYYAVFEVVDPAPNSAIRDNAGNVTISVALSPALRGDHKLLLVLDGQATEVEAQDNQFILSNVDRGSHTAAARIVNRDNALVAQSAETSFHLQRVAVGGARPAPTGP